MYLPSTPTSLLCRQLKEHNVVDVKTRHLTTWHVLVPQLIESTRSDGETGEGEPLSFEVGAGDVFANEMITVCRCGILVVKVMDYSISF